MSLLKYYLTMPTNKNRTWPNRDSHCLDVYAKMLKMGKCSLPLNVDFFYSSLNVTVFGLLTKFVCEKYALLMCDSIIKIILVISCNVTQ